MTAFQWVTLAIAMFGAALGIFNTWHSWRDRSVRLRVIPKYGDPFDSHGRSLNDPCISIEVQNLGAFPVTVEEVGLLIGKARGLLPARAPFPPGASIMGPTLPHRVERHDAFTVTLPLRLLPLENYSAAYARTAAGTLISGTSGALESIIEVMQSVRSRN